MSFVWGVIGIMFLHVFVICFIVSYTPKDSTLPISWQKNGMGVVTKQKRLILPYGMLLTRLFKVIVRENPELENESYVLYDRVMTPLAAQLERKPRRDRGMRRDYHHHKPSSYRTDLPSPTPPNAPSKTTSTNQTSSSQENTSSSFHSKLQISPPSSHEPTSPHHLNPLLDNISDVPPRPLNPQPLQSHPSLDITLSLSPITPLDHIHDTPSPPSQPQPQPPKNVLVDTKVTLWSN
ncbi:hypothetical protein Tco_1514596 [Tanacetum coccineum]